MKTQDITFTTTHHGPDVEPMLDQLRKMNDEDSRCTCDVHYLTDHYEDSRVDVIERHDYECPLAVAYRSRV